MLTTEPEVTPTAHRLWIGTRHGLLAICRPLVQQSIDLTSVKPGYSEVETGMLQLCDLLCHDLPIPFGPGSGAIHGQTECFHLALGPLVATEHRNLGYLQFPGCLEPQVSINQLTVAADEQW